MKVGRGVAICVCLALVAVCLGSAAAETGPETPPNWVPELSFSYVDPISGERLRCNGGCRRFEVPAGVDLEIRVQVHNMADDQASEAVGWDLWFDQPRRPFVGEDLSACWSSEGLDVNCWQAMLDRADWRWWNEQIADRVCVPREAGGCLDDTLVVPMNSDFEGSRGRGVYAFMAWVDRFGIHAEGDEFDNVAGPVRVKVMPGAATDTANLLIPAATSDEAEVSDTIFAPQTPKPFGFRVRTADVEVPFTLGSRIARANLLFIPKNPGPVAIEVDQVGEWEAMTVELRKVSTAEVLHQVSGKGPLRIDGHIGKDHLKDDRRMEVVVRQGHGTRGLRGTIRVSYPDRGFYIRGE